MAQSFAYLDAPSLIGSWPVLPTISGGAPSILPETLLAKATILSIRRETGTGYDVVGRTFFLDVDTVPIAIAFTGSGSLTLDDVISQINVLSQAGVGADVAFRDNGFLRLISPTIGGSSELKLRTDPASSPTDVFFTLGLFSETTSSGGDIKPADTIDPDRQVSLPGQLTLAEGESLDAAAINRVTLQLALNADRQQGLLERRPFAQTSEADIVDPSDGFTIPDLVYTGPDSLPTEDELEEIAVLLTEDGSRVVQKEITNFLVGNVTNWEIDESGAQRVTNGGGQFLLSDVNNEVYVRVSSGDLYKIIEYVDSDTVIIRAVDPVTGVDERTSGLVNWSRAEVEVQPVRVIALWTDAGKTVRVEQTSVVKDSGAVTRVDKNNRVVVSGATFVTNGVIPGDLLQYTGHSATFPYSNDGDYRVLRVIDEEVLELQAEDYSAAILNPTGTLGNVTITSSDDFHLNPFAELSHTVPNGNYKVLYKGKSTFKDLITARTDAFATSFLKYQSDSGEAVERSLLKIIGPNALQNGLDSWLYDDNRVNLESHEFRLQREHYDHDLFGPNGLSGHGGRHKDIRPDNINLFPGPTGTRIRLPDPTGILTNFSMSHTGESTWATAGFPTVKVYPDGRVQAQDLTGAFGNPGWTGISGQGTLDGDSSLYSTRDDSNTWKLVSSVLSAAEQTAHMIVDGAGVNARGKLSLRGRHPSFTGAQIGDGATQFEMVSDSAAVNPKEWMLVTHAAASIAANKGGAAGGSGIMQWQVTNDGTGSQYNSAFGIDKNGQVFMGKLPTYYGGFPSTLQIRRPANRFALVIDGDDQQADVMFLHENATPVANQNVTQFVGVTDGTFRFRSLSDTLALQDELLAFDLSSGRTAIGKATFMAEPATGALHDHSLQVQDGLYVGDFSGFPGYPSDADVGGSVNLSMLSGDGGFHVDVQDGAGRVNQYWNAFWDATTATHRRITTDPVMRFEWLTTGMFKFSSAASGGAAGDDITWVEGLNIDTAGVVTVPTGDLEVTLGDVEIRSGHLHIDTPGDLVIVDGTTGTLYIGQDFVTAKNSIYSNVYAPNAIVIQGVGQDTAGLNDTSITFNFLDGFTSKVAGRFDRRHTIGTSTWEPRLVVNHIAALGASWNDIGDAEDLLIRNARNSIVGLVSLTAAGAGKTTGGIWNFVSCTHSAGSAFYYVNWYIPIDTGNPAIASNQSSNNNVVCVYNPNTTQTRLEVLTAATGVGVEDQCAVVVIGSPNTFPGEILF